MTNLRKVYVLVRHKHTGDEVSRFGPMTERQAEKVENGLLDEIDCDHYVGEELADPKLSGRLV